MSERRKCFKCGVEEGTLRTWKRELKKGALRPVVIVPHHISYKPEIVVDCCISCHRKIHAKVRKENRCPLSVEQTDTISTNSSRKRYNSHTRNVFFNETVGDHVHFVERIMYNYKNGQFYYYSRFQGNGVYRLPTMEIE